VLPVTIKAGDQILEKEIFDLKKRESHFKTCPILKQPKLQQIEWHKSKKIIALNPEIIYISIEDRAPDLSDLPKKKEKKIRELLAEERSDHERRFAEILAAEKMEERIK